MTIVASAQSGLGSLNLQDGNNLLNNLANKYIVKPKTAKGIGGFVFDYEGEDTVTLQSEIPDHYLESNDPVEDHFALKPVKITMRGFVAELSQTAPAGVLGAITTIQNRLTTVPFYLGKYTPGAVQTIAKGLTSAQTVVNQINLGISKVQNLLGFLPGATPQKSKQQQAYLKLSSLWATRQIFTVQTPYGYFDSMGIESLTFIQPEDIKDWTDISVTMKQFRFVETLTVNDNGTFAARAALQRQTAANNGKTQGTPQPVSLLKSYYNAFASK